MELSIQRSEQSLATRMASSGSGQLNSVAKDGWEHEEPHTRELWEKNGGGRANCQRQCSRERVNVRFVLIGLGKTYTNQTKQSRNCKGHGKHFRTDL